MRPLRFAIAVAVPLLVSGCADEGPRAPPEITAAALYAACRSSTTATGFERCAQAIASHRTLSFWADFLAEMAEKNASTVRAGRFGEADGIDLIRMAARDAMAEERADAREDAAIARSERRSASLGLLSAGASMMQGSYASPSYTPPSLPFGRPVT